jgi:recombinational DNA repair protein (RecF pathway)
MKDNINKEAFSVKNGKISDHELFKDELSQEQEQSFDDYMYALKLNRAAKAELRRREAEKKVKELMDHLFDEYL